MDKDFLVLFSEIRRKQDVQTEILQCLVKEFKGMNETIRNFVIEQREFNKNKLISCADLGELNKQFNLLRNS
jgi:hypothetical protein